MRAKLLREKLFLKEIIVTVSIQTLQNLNFSFTLKFREAKLQREILILKSISYELKFIARKPEAIFNEVSNKDSCAFRTFCTNNVVSTHGRAFHTANNHIKLI
ncbi:MAG: hypothetical protein DRQ99_13940 [Candidatus Parabeggiatoa sp. nov. 3]|nr:MAG: hypothetical protein DRQ99_13940 [Gammaproteobacteria bacterium]